MNFPTDLTMQRIYNDQSLYTCSCINSRCFRSTFQCSSSQPSINDILNHSVLKTVNVQQPPSKGTLIATIGTTYVLLVQWRGRHRGLVSCALDHRSLPPEFDPRRGHSWRVFHLRLRFITFGCCSSHLAYHVHKSCRKTPIINQSSGITAILDWRNIHTNFNILSRHCIFFQKCSDLRRRITLKKVLFKYHNTPKPNVRQTSKVPLNVTFRPHCLHLIS